MFGHDRTKYLGMKLSTMLTNAKLMKGELWMVELPQRKPILFRSSEQIRITLKPKKKHFQNMRTTLKWMQWIVVQGAYSPWKHFQSQLHAFCHSAQHRELTSSSWANFTSTFDVWMDKVYFCRIYSGALNCNENAQVQVILFSFILGQIEWVQKLRYQFSTSLQAHSTLTKCQNYSLYAFH